MGIPQATIISTIYSLLPGFVSAWIFFGLTAHPKSSPFERTIQALIFTALTRAIVVPFHRSAIAVGDTFGALGDWTEDTGFVWSVVIAIGLGFIFASFANTGLLHRWLPDWVTKRTSFPSEWFSAFYRYPAFAYLHMTGSRRLYGWIEEWPDQPASGHFVIMSPEWVLDDNSRVRLLLTEAMLVSASDVEMVEFEIPPEKRRVSSDELESAKARMIDYNQEVKESPVEKVDADHKRLEEDRNE